MIKFGASNIYFRRIKMKPKEGVPGRNLGVSFVPETPDVGRYVNKYIYLFLEMINLSRDFCSES